MQSSIFSFFTPVKIYNGTPEGRLTKNSRETLPINELNSNPSKVDCPISTIHRGKKANRKVAVTLTHNDEDGDEDGNGAGASAGATQCSSPVKKTTPHDQYVLFFDGCSKHNPGPAGAGAVLYHNGVEIWSKSVFVGKKETNNVAEYVGMIMGISHAFELGIKRLVVKGDSNLVVQQMNGKFRVNAPNMKPLYAKAQSICRKFDSIQFIHVYRHLNTRADELSNLGLTL